MFWYLRFFIKESKARRIVFKAFLFPGMYMSQLKGVAGCKWVWLLNISSMCYYALATGFLFNGLLSWAFCTSLLAIWNMLLYMDAWLMFVSRQMSQRYRDGLDPLTGEKIDASRKTKSPVE